MHKKLSRDKDTILICRYVNEEDEKFETLPTGLPESLVKVSFWFIVYNVHEHL